MDALDLPLTKAINGLSGNTVVDTLMIWVSTYGVLALVLSVALQWWRKPGRSHTRHVLVASGFSFAFGLGLNQIILLLVQRPRPYDVGLTHLLIERSADMSFPSDHATATFAIAAAFLFHGMSRRGLAFLAAAMLISFSRVYLGTHFVGDIAGGALTGVMAAAVIWKLYLEGTFVDRRLTAML